MSQPLKQMIVMLVNINDIITDIKHINYTDNKMKDDFAHF